jgi:hypothetical protein
MKNPRASIGVQGKAITGAGCVLPPGIHRGARREHDAIFGNERAQSGIQVPVPERRPRHQSYEKYTTPIDACLAAASSVADGLSTAAASAGRNQWAPAQQMKRIFCTKPSVALCLMWRKIRLMLSPSDQSLSF